MPRNCQSGRETSGPVCRRLMACPTVSIRAIASDDLASLQARPWSETRWHWQGGQADRSDRFTTSADGRGSLSDRRCSPAASATTAEKARPGRGAGQRHRTGATAGPHAPTSVTGVSPPARMAGTDRPGRCPLLQALQSCAAPTFQGRSAAPACRWNSALRPNLVQKIPVYWGFLPADRSIT